MSNDCFDSTTNTILLSLLAVINDLQDRFIKHEKQTESKVTLMARKLENIEEKLDTFMKRTVEIEVNTEQMGHVMHKVIDRCKENIQDINCMKAAMSQQECRTENIEKRLIDNKDEIVELKWRSMKTNLIVTGLDYSQDEIPEDKLKSLFKEKLNVDEKIGFVSVHRFGKKGRNGIRPILAKFISTKEKELILRNKHKLKGTNIKIMEQFPREIEQKRKTLYPIAKRAKKEKRKVLLVRDKLFIDGNLHMSNLSPRQCENQNGNSTCHVVTPHYEPEINEQLNMKPGSRLKQQKPSYVFIHDHHHHHDSKHRKHQQNNLIS